MVWLLQLQCYVDFKKVSTRFWPCQLEITIFCTFQFNFCGDFALAIYAIGMMKKISLKKNVRTLSCLEASEGEVIVMKVASTTAAPTRPINFHQFTFLQENSDRLYIFWGAAIL